MKRNIIKKFVCILLIVSLCFTLSGCWNYVGLNEITIVIGIAIDKDDSGEGYKLAFEIIDLSGSTKESGPKPAIVESEGKTLFDAVRNAKRKLANKLYFGNIEIVIINNQIAIEEGVYEILDLFLRDAEPRETIHIVVSAEKTAKEILSSSGTNNKVTSTELDKIIENNEKVVSATKNVELYNAYNVLKGEGKELVLAAVHCVTDNEKKTLEANGIAVFKEGKLVGYLSPDETRYFLFADDEIKGGVLAFNLDEDEQSDVSLEISKSKTKKTYSFKDNRLKVKIDIKTSVYLDELKYDVDVSKNEEIKKVEEVANEFLKQEIADVIQKVQTDFSSDIFGFGSMIYKKDPKLWLQLKDDWDRYMRTMEIEINPDISILNTGYIRK